MLENVLHLIMAIGGILIFFAGSILVLRNKISKLRQNIIWPFSWLFAFISISSMVDYLRIESVLSMSKMGEIYLLVMVIVASILSVEYLINVYKTHQIEKLQKMVNKDELTF